MRHQPTVGVVGGGQLARMLAEAASPLGVHLRVLAAPGDEGAAEVVPDLVPGEPDDPVALRRLGESVDVLTIDHENVDFGTLAQLESEGLAVRPSPFTLGFADKAVQRRELARAGLPVPRFEVVDPSAAGSVERATAFAEAQGGEVVAKASRGGYDGRAVWMLGRDELRDFVERHEGAPLVLEPRLALDSEVAVLVARRPSGEMVTWPVLETVQVDGMCDEVVFPSGVGPGLDREAAEVASAVAEVCGAVGVVAVELFVVGGRVLVNEIAPRVHNTGHLTIEGSRTSQFEQHLRAILDWPLGPTGMRSAAVAMANVVGAGPGDPRSRQTEALEAVPEAHLHLYGKSVRPGRKVGHVTTLGPDRAEVRRRAKEAAGLLGGTGVGAPQEWDAEGRSKP